MSPSFMGGLNGPLTIKNSPFSEIERDNQISSDG